MEPICPDCNRPISECTADTCRMERHAGEVYTHLQIAPGCRIEIRESAGDVQSLVGITPTELGRLRAVVEAADRVQVASQPLPMDDAFMVDRAVMTRLFAALAALDRGEGHGS